MNVVPALPLMIVAGGACVALLASAGPGGRVRRDGPFWAGAATLIAAAVMSLVLWGDRQEALGGGYRADRFSMLLNLVFLAAAFCALLFSVREPAGVDRRGEYISLLLTSTAGMMLVAGAGDLIALFLGIEILSVALYVLCALEVWRERSLEAGLKYLIVGAVGSSFFLYGLAFLFGASGSVKLSVIGENLSVASFTDEPLLLVAMALIVTGLAFKASAVPFHMWTPDVYEGAPTPITAFMATATKVAALAAFLRIFGGALTDLVDTWQVAIGVVAAASVIVGNVGALVQRNFKRLLAYSSIAQAGYLLIGVAAGTLQGAESVLYYLIAYTAMTLAAFAVIIIREREVEDGEMVDALAGYGRARPVVGVVATVAMLSLAGFPPLSGFIGKFLLFGSAAEQGLWWLAVIGAVGSVVSVAYYLRVLRVMWFGTPAHGGEPRKLLTIPAPVLITAVTAAVAVVGFGLGASLLMDVCRDAAAALLAA
ncbi:MAG: NADH-quinone oxidoreductase subunit N [Thermoleophilia bacterium]|nr:NADH-quinone oxidoreductase subunit N [Thermoleophilia bacterium]